MAKNRAIDSSMPSLARARARMRVASSELMPSDAASSASAGGFRPVISAMMTNKDATLSGSRLILAAFLVSCCNLSDPSARASRQALRRILPLVVRGSSPDLTSTMR